MEMRSETCCCNSEEICVCECQKEKGFKSPPVSKAICTAMKLISTYITCHMVKLVCGIAMW